MITIDPIVFTIRCGKNHKKFGDPYTLACTAIKDGPNTVRVIAAVGEVTKEGLVELLNKFEEYGIYELHFERYVDGKIISKVLKNRKYSV